MTGGKSRGTTFFRRPFPARPLSGTVSRDTKSTVKAWHPHYLDINPALSLAILTVHTRVKEGAVLPDSRKKKLKTGPPRGIKFGWWNANH
ncbi:hypothetical protein HW555_003035 [Spodoptera exigua]|uniref:Uncharacterized protein n=1 Tax=Spodoptera exigua TaxID=7107 RepID=A0A835GPE3_SPOEX|nr:hypothetical protein HW555_003035 [Spodoptera exigua]